MNISLDLSSVVTDQPVEPCREIIRPIPDSDDYLLVLDNSSMEKFTTCPRASQYYSVYRREASGSSAALVFGGAVHVGLEQYYLGASQEKVISSALKFLQDKPIPVDDYRTPAALADLLIAYIERCDLPDYKLEVVDNGTKLIETAFEVPLGRIEVGAKIKLPQWQSYRPIRYIYLAWSGRMDIIGLAHEQIRVVDHKTSKIDDGNYLKSYLLATQTLGYVWASRQIWPELDITSFCLNLIRFKQPTGSGPITLPGPRGGKPALEFSRHYYNYSRDRINEWRENVLAICSDFISNLVRGYFPQHPQWCFGKYGQCQYHHVCSTDERNVRETILNSELYKTVTWDPTNER